MVYMARSTKGKALAGAGIILGIFFALIVPKAASAATLSLSPASGEYFVGRSFSVNVLVDSSDQAMNAVQGSLSFPSDLLHVLSVSTGNSIVNLWVEQPSFSNQDGSVNFQGVVINPGFEGSGGNIVTVTFQAVAPGAASIAFSSGSVLANDGQGTEILDTMSGANFTLTPLAPGPSSSNNNAGSTVLITSNPSIVNGTWYNLNAITFNWSVPSDADGVDYNISNNPNYQLPDVSQGLVSQTAYDLTTFDDGQWYFFVSFESGRTWSAPAVKPMWLDRTPPDPFVIVREDTNLMDSQPVFQWVATDKTSGIAYYEVKIGDGDWFNASSIEDGTSSEYTLPSQFPAASRTLTVRAFDEAGNYRDETINFQVEGSCGTTSFFINCAVSEFLDAWAWLVFIIGFIIALGACIAIYLLFRWRSGMQREMHEFRDRLDRDVHAIERDLGTGNDRLKGEVQHLEEDIDKNP